MIKINNKWGIVVDEMSYSPVRLDKPSKRKDKDYYARIGFYNTLQGAIGRVAEEMSREELKASDMSLDEAVEVIKKCYRELATAMAVTQPGSIEVRLG